MLIHGTWAGRGTHLIVHESLADILVATESDIARDRRLVLVEVAAEVLLSSLCTQQLLLLLLLREVKLVDASMAVLRSQS